MRNGKEMPNHEEREQLCITCARACGGCSWSESLEPVEGWEAVQTPPKYGNLQSWTILRCPEYVNEKDVPRRDPQEIDTHGMFLLLEAMMRRMRDDYVHGAGPASLPGTNRQLIEKFLKSKVAAKLLQIDDPDAVITSLRRMIRPGR